MKYRRDMDGLRALAILPVVLQHSGVSLVEGGFVGVDVFFVISGFLITRILFEELRTSTFSLLSFYERRARRILPALFSVLAMTLLLGGAYLSPNAYDELAEGALSAIFFGSNFWLWDISTDYFSSAADLNFLLHTWSLAIEEQFYLVFPFLLWAFLKLGRKTAALAIFMLFLVSLAAFVTVAQFDSITAFYLSPLRFWELSAGAILALIPLTGGGQMRREFAGILGLFLIIAAVVFFDLEQHASWAAPLLAVLGAFLLIFAGAEGQPLSSRILGTRPMVWVGLISYSLYLWHWPIIVAVRHHTGRIHLAGTEIIGAILASFLIAWISWRFVEQPFRKSGEAKFRRRPMLTMLAAFAVVLITAGAWVSETAGLPSRMPADARAAFAAVHDRAAVRRFCPKGELSNPDFCQSNDGPVDVLVWGDSHAMAAWPGIEAALIENGKNGRLSWLNACPPLLRIARKTVPECPDFNDAVLAQIAANSDIELVVLSARWALAAEGRRIEGESGEDVVIWDDELTRENAKLDTNIDVFRRGFDRTINALENIGVPVVIVGNVPELTFSVPDRLSFAMWKGDPRPEGPVTEDIRRRHKKVEHVMASLMNRKDVTVLDVASAMCSRMCDIARNGRPYYFDDDHLSAFGAQEIVAPLLGAYLSKR